MLEAWKRSAPPSPGRASSASTDKAIIAGVCAGVGRRFGLTPWVTRLLFVVTLFVLPGSQILVYPLLWFLMPSEDSIEAAAAAPHLR